MFEKLRKMFGLVEQPPEPSSTAGITVTSTLDSIEPTLDDLVAENLALGKQGDRIRARRLELQKQIAEAVFRLDWGFVCEHP